MAARGGSYPEYEAPVGSAGSGGSIPGTVDQNGSVRAALTGAGSLGGVRPVIPRSNVVRWKAFGTDGFDVYEEPEFSKSTATETQGMFSDIIISRPA